MQIRSYTTKKFESMYTYTGSDLGAVWNKDATHFRLWAPTAQSVNIRLYAGGTAGVDDLIRTIAMTADVKGTWTAEIPGDLNGVYYTYLVTRDGKTVEACDPYARAVGVNGLRAMVIDLASTDPVGWKQDQDPHAGIPATDVIVYEQHIRDMSAHPSSGIKNKGQYLGMVETGTATDSGIPTGIDHVRNLGVTHIQLLPIYDFGFTDESLPDGGQYNWGYDPVNYNVPEGSYSSDPFHGEVRVREVKEMIKGFHDQGLSVVMDVVYNHVYDADTFCFNQIVPGYFSRKDRKGAYTNNSACGNDNASERSMVRKYIVDSVKYWVEEYHIDGFRFDLVGLIDIQTIREVVAQVRKNHPNVIFYGEGWDMCNAPSVSNVPMTVQKNADLVPSFGFFNDTIRDVLHGSVFDSKEPGFITGQKRKYWDLAFCYAGVPSWTKHPEQSVNYVSCHDNHTLFDRITEAVPKASFADRIRMNKLAAAFVFTARGIPFFLGGEEMLRTKPDGKGGLDHNSYRAGDAVNSIKWDTLEKPEYMDVLNYYKGLITFRNTHPQVRTGSPDEVIPVDTGNDHCVAYFVKEDLFAIFNAGPTAITLPLPDGQWEIFVDGTKAGSTPLLTVKDSIDVAPICAAILCRKE